VAAGSGCLPGGVACFLLRPGPKADDAGAIAPVTSLLPAERVVRLYDRWVRGASAAKVGCFANGCSSGAANRWQHAS
jgi:hypothetical protein